MDHNIAIGNKVKQLRSQQELTLKQLSEATGLSTGFLSQLERGISTVAIDSLAKISQALDVELLSFFGPELRNRTEPVLRSFEVPYKQVGNQILEGVLSHDVTGFDILTREFKLLPSAKSDEPHAVVYSHTGEEILYVLEGVLTVYLNGNIHTMYPGDSMQLKSSSDHNWENRTNQVVRFLQMNFPNPYQTGRESE